MKNRDELTALTIMSALLVLLAIPTTLGVNHQIVIESIVFLVGLQVGYKFLRSEHKKFGLVFLVIIFSFNPVFIFLQYFTLFWIDLALGFTLFGTALYLSQPQD